MSVCMWSICMRHTIYGALFEELMHGILLNTSADRSLQKLVLIMFCCIATICVIAISRQTWGGISPNLTFRLTLAHVGSDKCISVCFGVYGPTNCATMLPYLGFS